MTDEGRSGGADDAGADPFDVELPPGWSAQRREGTTAYQNESGDHRVRIVEFSCATFPSASTKFSAKR